MIEGKAYLLFFTIFFFHICLLAFAEEVHYGHKSPFVKVSVSPLGTSWLTATDFFTETGAPKGEKLESSFSFERWHSLFELPLETTDIKEWYSVSITKDRKKKWEEMIKKNFFYCIFVGGKKKCIPFGTINDGQPMTYMKKDFFFVLSSRGVVLSHVVPSLPSPIELQKNATFSFSVTILPMREFTSRFNVVEDTFKSTGTIVNVLLLLFLLICSYVFVVKRIAKVFESQVDNLRFNAIVSGVSSWQLLSADVFRRTRSGISLSAFVGAGASHFFLLLSLSSFSETGNTFFFFALSFFWGGCIAGYCILKNVLHPITRSKALKCLFLMTTVIAFPYVFVVSAFLIRNIFSRYVTTDDAMNPLFLLFRLMAGSFFSFCGIQTSMIVSKKLLIGVRLPQVNQVPRLVPPPLNRLLRKKNIVLLSGFVIFVTIAENFDIYLKKSFLFSSVSSLLSWEYLIFFLLSSFCVSLLGTFALLNTEEHAWKWVSFGLGSSVSVYLVLYSLIFYIVHIGSFSIINVVVFCSYVLGSVFFIAFLGGAFCFIFASFLVDILYGKIMGKKL